MNKFTIDTLEIEAKKAVYSVLRMLHAKTGSNKLHALQNAMHWSIDDQDSTITADLLQAARTALVEYCINYGYDIYEVIDHSKKGRAITPFSKACSAVRNALMNYSTCGMKGDTSKTRNIEFVPINAENSNEYGTYNDDTSAIVLDSVIMEIFESEERLLIMIELLSQGYDMKNISEKMRMSQAATYRLRDKIRKKMLDSGFFDGYR